MPLTEIADRVWVWTPRDGTTVTVVGGSDGLALVDLPVDEDGVRRLLGETRDLVVGGARGQIRALAWTHGHPAHVGATAVLHAELGPVPVHAHEAAAALGAVTAAVAVDVAFSSVSVLDLGDRTVELVHLGRGHSDGDVVAVVPGADVVAAGDLVAPAGDVPDLGADCFPLDWPLTLDLLLGLVGPTTQVVPGHGAPVDRTVVEDQRQALGAVAETTRDLVERGVPLDRALEDPAAAGTWPYPTASLGHAVARGYAHLPRSQRRLPLV